MSLTRRTVLMAVMFSAALAVPSLPNQEGGTAAKTDFSQTIGILPFQDASGGDYGESLAKVLAKKLQAALLNASNLTPRFLKPGEDSEDVEQIDMDTALKLARAQKVDFAVLGTLLTAEVSESEGGLSAPSIGGVSAGGRQHSQAAEVVLQVDLIDVGRGQKIASLRSSGKERDTKISADVYTDYGSMDMGGADFQNSVLGKATQKAITEAVKQMLPKLRTPTADRSASGGTTQAAATGAASQATSVSAQAPAEIYGTAEVRADNRRAELARIQP